MQSVAESSISRKKQYFPHQHADCIRLVKNYFHNTAPCFSKQLTTYQKNIPITIDIHIYSLYLDRLV